MASTSSLTEMPFSIPHALSQIQGALQSTTTDALPPPHRIHHASTKIHASLPAHGLGPATTLTHILTDLSPGFNGSKTSGNYYGFVTGGVLPIAEAADHVVTSWDQNVQVHLPHQGVATSVEWRAGGLLVELLGLGGEGRWRGRTFTTGATASNVLGLACGREAVLAGKIRARRAGTTRKGEGESEKEQDLGMESDSVGESGLLESCKQAGVDDFQVLTTMGHSSLSKAASIVGLGRKNVKDVGLPSTPWRFDMKKLEVLLGKPGTASIVVVSCGEVNTGRYATNGLIEMNGIRNLCDRFGAWLHVDGAFGLFARALPAGDEFALLHKACEGIELADSITGDAHKCLNVPYDCGFFLTPSLPLLTSIFQNPNAAYLSSNNPAGAIPSPLNIGIENSRRFRALPVYAVLVAYGLSGLSEIFARQVRLARLIAKFVDAHPGYELLPAVAAAEQSQREQSQGEPSQTAASPKNVNPGTTKATLPHAQIGIVVLFRAADPDVNADLAARINRSGKIMVSRTAWEGRPAVRIAVSTWMVQEERDLAVVREVLEGALL